MECCWADNPEERPTFNTVEKTIKQLQGWATVLEGIVMIDFTTFNKGQWQYWNCYDWFQHIQQGSVTVLELLWLISPHSTRVSDSLGIVMINFTTFNKGQRQYWNCYDWFHHIQQGSATILELLWLFSPHSTRVSDSIGIVMVVFTTFNKGQWQYCYGCFHHIQQGSVTILELLWLFSPHSTRVSDSIGIVMIVFTILTRVGDSIGIVMIVFTTFNKGQWQYWNCYDCFHHIQQGSVTILELLWLFSPHSTRVGDSIGIVMIVFTTFNKGQWQYWNCYDWFHHIQQGWVTVLELLWLFSQY